MATKLDTVEAKALRLGLRDRARLAEKLLLSLDAPSDEENLRLWVAEAERRLQELRTGKDKEIPARTVFKRARAVIA
jgi:putative addiction module component (TIGR02574 family)